MMRWHIAGPAMKTNNRLKDELIALGDEVSARWLRPEKAVEDPDTEDLANAAIDEMDDIAKSHGLVYVLPSKADPEPKSETAMGIAIALNKRVVLVGEPKQQYHHLPNLERYKSVKEFIETREDEKNVDV